MNYLKEVKMHRESEDCGDSGEEGGILLFSLNSESMIVLLIKYNESHICKCRFSSSHI